MTQQRLSPNDWLAAGFRALAQDGPSALRAEALARSLGTTKGSFYWHFKDLPAYKSAMLTLWQTKVATEIIDQVRQHKTPKDRLEALLTLAAQPAPDAFGGRAIEPAVRAWALVDDDVMAQIQITDRSRIAFLEELLADLGHDDPVLAQSVYAAFLGLDDLEAKGSGTVASGLRALFSLILR